MKTSVTMLREMGKYTVSQRTKDGYFDANFLISQWNKNNKRRRIDDFLNSKSTIEFIETLQEDLAIGENPPMAISIKKGRNTSKGRTKDEVWLHPYLFIDFAMWINPRFKLQVIKFVYDKLIENRHKAGDNYKILSASGSKLPGYDYVNVAKGLQWIVFGKTGKNLRQEATQDQLEELKNVQIKLSYAIDMGFIKTYSELISQMRKMYYLKHNNLQNNLH